MGTHLALARVAGLHRKKPGCHCAWSAPDLARAARRLYDDNIALYGKRYYYYIWELPVFVLMGLFAGLLGAAFIRLNVRVTALRARWVPPRRPHLRLLEVRALGPFFAAVT